MIEGGNFAFFWTQGGVSVCDPAGRGVGLCSPDAPALSLGEPGIYKFKGQWPNPKSSVYVHLFNNKWNTNFRSFWNGEFSARVRLWPIAKFDAEKDLVTPSEETLAPMLTGLSNYKAGPAAARRPGPGAFAQGRHRDRLRPEPRRRRHVAAPLGTGRHQRGLHRDAASGDESKVDSAGGLARSTRR